MLINTTRVAMVLMNRAIPANYLEKELGISRSTITRVRNGERKFENLTLETIRETIALVTIIASLSKNLKLT